MRLCTTCHIEKPFTDFAIRNKTKGTYQSSCRACVKLRDKERWDNDPTRRQMKYENTKALRERNLKHVWDHFSKNPCTSCGESDPRVLEFDHLDPDTKHKNVSDMVSNSSIETLDAEIAKCRVLCANCHRKHTYQQFGWRTFD